MRRRSPRSWIVGIAALGLLASAGCGGGNTDSGGGGDGEPDRSAIIHATNQSTITSWDPMTSQSELDQGQYLNYVYDRLTMVDADGIAQPLLATSWELAPDGSTFTMSLREGVTFSDGAPMDAAAVKANIDRYLTDPKSLRKADLPGIASVDVVDPLTVRMNLDGPGGALPLAMSTRAGMMVSPEAFDNPDLDQQPVGSGGLVLTNAQPPARYEFERREDYWDEDSFQYAGLELTNNDGSAVINMLQTQEVDFAGLQGSQSQEAESLGLQVRVSPPSGSAARILLNTDRNENLAKPGVMQAINLAIDRKAVSEVAYNGLCEPTVQPYPEGHFAHSDSIDDADWGLPRDVDTAKDLLADAGLADGFEMSMLVPNTPSNITRAQMYQQNLADIGITVNLEVHEVTQVRVVYLTGGGDSYAGDVGLFPDPALFVQAHYLEGGVQNPGNFAAPDVPELALEAMESTDPDERGTVYDELFAKVYEAGTDHVFVCHHEGATAYQDNFVLDDQYVGPAGADGMRGYYKTAA